MEGSGKLGEKALDCDANRAGHPLAVFRPEAAFDLPSDAATAA
jgi:hypothetical protein